MKETRPQRNDLGVVIAVVVLIAAVGAAWFLARAKTPAPAKATVTAPADTAPATVASTPAETTTTSAPASSAVALPPPQSPRAAAISPAAQAASQALEPTPAQLAAVPRVPTSDLAQKLAAGAVTVIDVRDADSYIAGHIAGAMHIPLQYLAGEVPYLPKDKPIVTYCT